MRRGTFTESTTSGDASRAGRAEGKRSTGQCHAAPTTLPQFTTEQTRPLEERTDRNGSECRPPRSGKRAREKGAEPTENRGDDASGGVPMLTKNRLNTLFPSEGPEERPSRSRTENWSTYMSVQIGVEQHEGAG